MATSTIGTYVAPLVPKSGQKKYNIDLPLHVHTSMQSEVRHMGTVGNADCDPLRFWKRDAANCVLLKMDGS